MPEVNAKFSQYVTDFQKKPSFSCFYQALIQIANLHDELDEDNKTLFRALYYFALLRILFNIHLEKTEIKESGTTLVSVGCLTEMLQLIEKNEFDNCKKLLEEGFAFATNAPLPSDFVKAHCVHIVVEKLLAENDAPLFEPLKICLATIRAKILNPKHSVIYRDRGFNVGIVIGLIGVLAVGLAFKFASFPLLCVGAGFMLGGAIVAGVATVFRVPSNHGELHVRKSRSFLSRKVDHKTLTLDALENFHTLLLPENRAVETLVLRGRCRDPAVWSDFRDTLAHCPTVTTIDVRHLKCTAAQLEALRNLPNITLEEKVTRSLVSVP